jgi:hypothetical protein
MPRQVDIGLPGKGSRQENGNRLSLNQFNELTQSYLTLITEAEHSLQRIITPFKEKGDIRPIQCRKASDSLRETIEYVQEFCEALNKTSSLPVILIALRYRILTTLHLTEEQASKLIDLIDSFLVICMKHSSHTLQLRKEIYTSFETLLQHMTDISQKTRLLNDEARFQEKILIANFEEK